jgi:hypothetical protein
MPIGNTALYPLSSRFSETVPFRQPSFLQPGGYFNGPLLELDEEDNEQKLTKNNVMRYQLNAEEQVRERGRVLVVSGEQIRNRDWYTNKHLRLVPGGLRLEYWQKNPLILYMHLSGVPMGKGELFMEDGRLWAYEDFEFHRKSVPVVTLAGIGMFDTGVIADLWNEKFLNAVSVHVIFTKDDEKNFFENEDEVILPTGEVIETSIVTLPGDRHSVREGFELEFVDRLIHKGVEADMAECIACKPGQLYVPSHLPIWKDNNGSKAANSGSSNVYPVVKPEDNMSVLGQSKTEAAEGIEEKQFESLPPVEGEIQETQEHVEVAIEVEAVEEVFEIDGLSIINAILSDPEAMRLLADGLTGVPGFAESLAAGVLTQASVQRPQFRLKLVGAESPRQVPVASPTRPEVVQASAAPSVPIPQANGKRQGTLTSMVRKEK